MKNASRRFSFMFSIIKRQNQTSNEDDIELKENSDALFIENEKLIVHYDKQLGTGVCSAVYRGFLSGLAPLAKLSSLVDAQKFRDCEVAVKHALHFGDHEVEQLFREIEAMKILEYDRNVISMLGWRMINDKPAIVFELAQGDLLRYVKMQKLKVKQEIPFKTIISILWQIAKGMEFIASKSIVHRDLAARNVLLTNDFQAKISDFGLAVINNTDLKGTTLVKKFPVRWMSIEAIAEKLFSEKSDVWAFGILMFEVFSLGQDPYEGIETRQILRFLRSGERLSRPELATNEMYEMMCRCWEENLETRPKFEELVAKLHDVLEDESGYSKYYDELELLQEEKESDTANENNSVALEVLDDNSL
uniref:Protein kinase domain-containing protein n=1 Tax=Acrobeloides nanus TaxID=290746 RepID=A0A914CSN1_9BILA